MIERVLNMKFLDKDGGSFNFAIKDVKADLEDEVISQAMDSIITNDVFISKGGQLATKEEAKIVVKETKEVIL